MSDYEKILCVVLAVVWVRLIWQGVCIKNLTEELETTRRQCLDWIYELGKGLDNYVDMPDNLRDYEKRIIEKNQKKAKEQAKEWEKKDV